MYCKNKTINEINYFKTAYFNYCVRRYIFIIDAFIHFYIHLYYIHTSLYAYKDICIDLCKKNLWVKGAVCFKFSFDITCTNQVLILITLQFLNIILMLTCSICLHQNWTNSSNCDNCS